MVASCVPPWLAREASATSGVDDVGGELAGRHTDS
jgi:hypothetical protein